MRAGIALRDVTPEPGTTMSGFAARTQPATGTHDPLLVHALVVEDTAVVTVDVVGLHEEDCEEIRQRCPLPAERVIVHATHTHGGPASMHGRLAQPVDKRWLATLIDACVDGVTEATESREAVHLEATEVTALGVAQNRRRPDGPVDDCMPLIVLRRTNGSVLGVLMSYACHPVVLGADNTMFTADYPGVVRRMISERVEGAPVLFMTGCAGDANTGHKASDSITTQGSADRTFEECERVGRTLADRAIEALFSGTMADADGQVHSAYALVKLALDVPQIGDLVANVAAWRAERETAEPARAALLKSWIAWGTALLERPDAAPTEWIAPVTVLQWGSVNIIGLPGEPFAIAAHQLRASVKQVMPDVMMLCAGYSNGCPGYLPAAREYPLRGYEVRDAHRYYGMAGPFAPGSLERLLMAAEGLVMTCAFHRT